MSIFSRTTLALPVIASLLLASGCDFLPDDDDSAGDDDDSAGADTELDCADTLDNDADGLTDCDDPDCAADDACAGPDWIWVAVRSRTATQADIENNTPGPDIDAVELFNGVTSEFVDAASISFVQGEAAAAGNTNANAVRVSGIPDSFLDGGDCDLAEEPNGTFWSMGGGAVALGVEGFFVAMFENTTGIVSGDTITVYEVGAGGCANVGTARDDEYEVYIGTSDVDDLNLDIDSLDGAEFMSLGTTGAGGDTFTVTVP